MTYLRNVLLPVVGSMVLWGCGDDCGSFGQPGCVSSVPLPPATPIPATVQAPPAVGGEVVPPAVVIPPVPEAPAAQPPATQPPAVALPGVPAAPPPPAGNEVPVAPPAETPATPANPAVAPPGNEVPAVAPPMETPATPATPGVEPSDPPPGTAAPSPPMGAPAYPTVEDMFRHLPSGEEQRLRLCERGGTDTIRELFCSEAPPTITSLKQLVDAVGLGFKVPFAEGGRVAAGINPGIAITGHSSSLVARNVSQINPRAIYFTSPNGLTREPDGRLPRLAFLGFVRGEQFVEFISNSEDDRDTLSFFLIRFEQACNADHSCSVGDLLSPAIEKDWTGLTIYEDDDIENTVVDCKRCHQPDGPSSQKILRLQEFKVNWTHFFRNKGPNNTALQVNPGIDFDGTLVGGDEAVPGLEGGLALLNDFHKAHGYAEDYAAIPADFIPESAPIFLEDIIKFKGDRDKQANEYNGLVIEQEIKSLNPFQPMDNSVPGKSPTWEKLYDNYLYGNVIAPPYHDVKVTDPVKLEAMSKSYRSFVDGEITADELPDIRDAFLESQQWKMGFAAKPGLDGQGIITQLCSTCHNEKLNQNLSRARFDADLTKMSMEQRATAAERLQLPDDHLLKMPPAGSSSLTAQQVDLLVQTLMSTGPLVADIQPTTHLVGSAVSQPFKNAGAPAIQCTSENLPAGLTLSVQDGTCVLSGILAEASPLALYSVFAESADGQVDRGTIKLAAVASLPPELGNLEAQACVLDQAMPAISFFNSGNAAVECSAAPPLPAGLTVAPVGNTCELSGTPTNLVDPMTYFVTATAAGGATESGFVHISVAEE